MYKDGVPLTRGEGSKTETKNILCGVENCLGSEAAAWRLQDEMLFVRALKRGGENGIPGESGSSSLNLLRSVVLNQLGVVSLQQTGMV